MRLYQQKRYMQIDSNMIACEWKQTQEGRWYCPYCDEGRKRTLPRVAHRRCRARMQPDESTTIRESLPQLVRTFLEQYNIPKDTVETWYKAADSCSESRERRAQLNKWAGAVLRGELAEPKAELEKLIAL